MKPKLVEFPKYVSNGKSILLRQGHFFVQGSGTISTDKSEKLTILSNVVHNLESGIDSCLIYPASRDIKTKEALKTNTAIANNHNQLSFNRTTSGLVELCDTYSDEDCNCLWISILFRLNRNDVNWQTFFSSLYDPGFLENPKNIITPAAYNYAKRTVSDKHVVIIVYSTAYFFPSFLVFEQTKNSIFSQNMP